MGLLALLALSFSVPACGGSEAPNNVHKKDDGKKDEQKKDDGKKEETGDVFNVKDVYGFQAQDVWVFEQQLGVFSRFTLELYDFDSDDDGKPLNYPAKLLYVNMVTDEPIEAGFTIKFDGDLDNEYVLPQLLTQDSATSKAVNYFATSGSLEISKIEDGKIVAALKDVVFAPIDCDKEYNCEFLDGGKTYKFKSISIDSDKFVQVDCIAEANTDAETLEDLYEEKGVKYLCVDQFLAD